MIMKKSKNLLTCLFLFIAAVAHADNDRPIQASRLPEPAQRFIERHFPDRTIALAKEETEFLQKSYEVIFTDGCQVCSSTVSSVENRIQESGYDTMGMERGLSRKITHNRMAADRRINRIFFFARFMIFFTFYPFLIKFFLPSFSLLS